MPKIEVRCAACGKPILRYPSQVLEHTFCSRECARSFTSARMTAYNQTDNPMNTSAGWSKAQRAAGRGGGVMREGMGLYRGKRVDNGEWVYGSLLVFADGEMHLCRDEDDDPDILTERKVDPATVGEYTGLTDKDGTKIFEGDIISGNCSGKGKECFEVWWGPGNCGFVAGRGVRMRPNLNPGTVKNYEVVGSIHDDPELMGENP